MKHNSAKLIRVIRNLEIDSQDTTRTLANRNKADRQAKHFTKSLDAIVSDYPSNVIEVSRSMAKHITRNQPSKVKRANWKCINSHCRMFEVTQKDKEVFKFTANQNGKKSIVSLCKNEFCRSRLVKLAYDFESEKRVSTLPKYHCSKCAKFVKQFSARIAITEKIERGEVPFCPNCGNTITTTKGFRKVKE